MRLTAPLVAVHLSHARCRKQALESIGCWAAAHLRYGAIPDARVRNGRALRGISEASISQLWAGLAERQAPRKGAGAHCPVLGFAVGCI